MIKVNKQIDYTGRSHVISIYIFGIPIFKCLINS